jgi:hypothetical protein
MSGLEIPAIVAAVGAAASAAAPYVAVAGAVAGAATTYMGAQYAADQRRVQARMAQFNATSEAIRGQVQANQTREQLVRALATQSARYAGSGLALEGTPDLVAEQTMLQANRELTMQGANATIRSEQQRQRAQLLNADADYTEIGGAVGAGVNLFQTVNNRLSNLPGQVKTSTSKGYTGGDGSASGGSWP